MSLVQTAFGRRIEFVRWSSVIPRQTKMCI